MYFADMSWVLIFEIFFWITLASLCGLNHCKFAFSIFDSLDKFYFSLVQQRTTITMVSSTEYGWFKSASWLIVLLDKQQVSHSQRANFVFVFIIIIIIIISPFVVFYIILFSFHMCWLCLCFLAIVSVLGWLFEYLELTAGSMLRMDVPYWCFYSPRWFIVMSFQSEENLILIHFNLRSQCTCSHSRVNHFQSFR